MYFCQAGTKAVTNELSKCRSLSYRTIIGHTRPIHGSLSYKIKSMWIRLTEIIYLQVLSYSELNLSSCMWIQVCLHNELLLNIYFLPRSKPFAFKAHFQCQLLQIPTWQENIIYFQLSFTILSFSLPTQTSILFYEPRQESLS